MDALVYIGILLAGLVPGLYMLAQYNSLIELRNRTRQGWSDIDAALKRRYDLIPRLVEIVRGYAAHEREVFEQIITLRDRCAANHGPVSSRAKDEIELVNGLQILLARAEAYPELQAGAPFQSLHAELVKTEDGIQAARSSYNRHVRNLRNKCESFPSSLVAQMFGFRPSPFFSVESALREAPEVRI